MVVSVKTIGRKVDFVEKAASTLFSETDFYSSYIGGFA